VTDVETLLAIEDIKRVKARYFYHLDRKDWDGWRRDVFAPEATISVDGMQEEPVGPRDTLIAWVAEKMATVKSVHHGHMPDISFTSDDTADVIWAMEDILHYDPPAPDGTVFIQGYGHYIETYRRTDAGWRIASTRLTRLHVERR